MGIITTILNIVAAQRLIISYQVFILATPKAVRGIKNINILLAL